MMKQAIFRSMTMAYYRYYSVDTHIVRIFNTYGPRMRFERWDARCPTSCIKR